MGLDMYLSGKKFLWTGERQKVDVSKLMPLGFKHEPKEIRFEIMYWRKANAIHKWFVDNVQDGEDDCKTYPVSVEKLSGLRETIKEVLTDMARVVHRLNRKIVPAKAKSVLPTTSGFFFGGEEYDEFYWKGLEDTLKMLNQILDNPEMYKDIEFDYHSSW